MLDPLLKKQRVPTAPQQTEVKDNFSKQGIKSGCGCNCEVTLWIMGHRPKAVVVCEVLNFSGLAKVLLSF